MLLKNLGNGRFVDVAMALGCDDIRDGRGVAVADFDNDGDFDLVVNNNPGIGQEIAPILYRNDIGQQNNWLEVDLVGTLANRDAAGSEVRLELPNGQKLLRHVVIGSGYASQQSRRLGFGLGQATEITRMKVRWLGPGGGEDTFEHVTPNQILRITQGGRGEAAQLLTHIQPAGKESGAQLGQNPAPAPTVVAAESPTAAPATRP